MNMFERQAEITRQLFELNAEWMRKISEFDSEKVRSYVEFNQEFAKKLPEVKDFQSFMDLQREYNEQLWSGAQETMRARGEMLREVAEANGEVLRDAFAPAEGAKAA